MIQSAIQKYFVLTLNLHGKQKNLSLNRQKAALFKQDWLHHITFLL